MKHFTLFIIILLFIISPTFADDIQKPPRLVSSMVSWIVNGLSSASAKAYKNTFFNSLNKDENKPFELEAAEVLEILLQNKASEPSIKNVQKFISESHLSALPDKEQQELLSIYKMYYSEKKIANSIRIVDKINSNKVSLFDPAQNLELDEPDNRTEAVANIQTPTSTSEEFVAEIADSAPILPSTLFEKTKPSPAVATKSIKRGGRPKGRPFRGAQ